MGCFNIEKYAKLGYDHEFIDELIAIANSILDHVHDANLLEPYADRPVLAYRINKFVEIHFVFETRHNVRAVDVKDAISMLKD